MAKKNPPEWLKFVEREAAGWVHALNPLAAPSYPEHGRFTPTGALFVDGLAKAAWHARWAIELGRLDTLRQHLEHLVQAERACGALVEYMRTTQLAAHEVEHVHTVLNATAVARSILFDAVGTPKIHFSE